MVEVRLQGVKKIPAVPVSDLIPVMEILSLPREKVKYGIIRIQEDLFHLRAGKGGLACKIFGICTAM